MSVNKLGMTTVYDPHSPCPPPRKVLFLSIQQLIFGSYNVMELTCHCMHFLGGRDDHLAWAWYFGLFFLTSSVTRLQRDVLQLLYAGVGMGFYFYSFSIIILIISKKPMKTGWFTVRTQYATCKKCQHLVLNDSGGRVRVPGLNHGWIDIYLDVPPSCTAIQPILPSLRPDWNNQVVIPT